MSSIQEEILNQVFSNLAESEEFEPERLLRLRELLVAHKKPKVSSLVEALSIDPKETIS